MTRLPPAVAIVVVALLVGCDATETGNPGLVLADPIEPADLDVSFAPDDVPGPTSPRVYARIDGAPGAVDPPTGTIVAWVLLDGTPAVREAVAPDGSFRLDLALESASPVRLRVERDGGRSIALDGFLDATAGFVPVERALPCVTVAPSLDLDLPVPGERVLRVENTCATAVAVDEVRLRAGAPGLSLAGPPSTELASGAAFEVTVSASEGASLEDIVLLSFGADGEALYAVHVRPTE